MTNSDRGRITARVSKRVMDTIQEAADLTGATLNQFLTQAALEKAEKVIDREGTIRFTVEDATMLINLLDKPPQTNTALAKAFERLRRTSN